MVGVPARCTRCGLAFTDSGIEVSDSRDMQFSSNMTDCPNCGAPARILDGRFHVVDEGIVMLSGPQWSWDLVSELRLALRRIVEERPADPVAELAKTSPELATEVARITHFWTYDNVIKLITVICAVLGVVFAGYAAFKPQEELSPEELGRIVKAVLEEAEQAKAPPPAPPSK